MLPDTPKFHWILYNSERRTVWVGDRDTTDFETEADAIAELKAQEAKLGEEQTHGFVVERRSGAASKAQNKKPDIIDPRNPPYWVRD